ncbi:MAG: hypothetical protein JW828_14675 [Sedimentisphaerales bacterium]|nr:hypothetical protein [Sedimentisphaerales bacterium]
MDDFDISPLDPRYYRVLAIGGNGKRLETGGFFDCGFENWWLGSLSVSGESYDFAVTCLGVGSTFFGAYDSVFVDRDQDGSYDGPGEGPFISGDNVELAGRRYAVTIGFEGTRTPGDIKLTYPCAEEISEHLKLYYEAVGSIPQYLCIVGDIDAIPPGLVAAHPYSDVEDIPTDLPLASADADVFAETCTGRIIGNNYHYVTLLAARSVVYEDLIDASWSQRMLSIAGEDGQVGVVKYITNSLENVGFDAPLEVFHYGKYEDDQMVDRSVIVHFNHAGETSWVGGPNKLFPALLALCVAQSGGCLSANLDLNQYTTNTIARRFLRRGAVAYIGNSRQASNPIVQYISQFWSGMTDGMTLGQAHRRAQNAKLCRHMEDESFGSGYNYIAAYEATLYGDPALKIYIPASPTVRPAHSEFGPSSLIVHGPEQWRDDLLPTDFHAYTGYGVSQDNFMWNPRYFAEYRTLLAVKSLDQVTDTSEPLGWNGSWFIDEHQDGTRSVYWLTQLLDYDMNTGSITDSLDRIEYAIDFLCDLDNDCDVDGYDLDILASNWLVETCVERDHCSGADINSDGAVDLTDLSVFAADWTEKSLP